ncbi:MAG: hypothetical protein ACPGSD_17300 [Flavobacteriales bacterium]|jgi:chromosome condensin MukBEF MukE localization factor
MNSKESKNGVDFSTDVLKMYKGGFKSIIDDMLKILKEEDLPKDAPFHISYFSMNDNEAFISVEFPDETEIIYKRYNNNCIKAGFVFTYDRNILKTILE